MTRGKPQQETSVGDGGDGSHVGGGGGWGGGNDDSIAGGGCGGDDSDGVLRQRAAPQAATALALRKTHDQARGHSVRGTQPRPRRVDVPQHLIATPSALGRPKRDRAVGEDDRASVYFAVHESRQCEFRVTRTVTCAQVCELCRL